MDQPLAPLAEALLTAFQKRETFTQEGKISVNPLISKVATWYERLRNVMEYREDEIILRAAIERILKRRIILLGSNAKKIAEPLVRELVWARYFPDHSFSDQIIQEVEDKINIHLYLREQMLAKHNLDEGTSDSWFYHLLSSSLEKTLNLQAEKETMTNFMYQVMRENVQILDDSEQNRDVQVFIAVRKAFARDDLAFLRYQLFNQYFGQLTQETYEDIAARFTEGYVEIQKQLNYPRKDTIYTYVKDKSAVFLILYDLLRVHQGDLAQIAQTPDEFKDTIFAACEARYTEISAKVQRSIVKSVLFILLTKVLFAFGVEGTYERLVYGRVMWLSIIMNTGIPPILMILAGILIKPPGKDNSKLIFEYIQKLLFEEQPKLGRPLEIQKQQKQIKPVLNSVFNLLWFLSFLVSFGIIVFVLSKLGFSYVSQGIFLFFLAVVSFLSYRISLMSKQYTVLGRMGWLTPLSDFFFMPIVRVGSHLTEGVSQINIFLFIFDFIIEAPFKGIFGFIEQWFSFLYQKRERLG